MLDLCSSSNDTYICHTVSKLRAQSGHYDRNIYHTASEIFLDPQVHLQFKARLTLLQLWCVADAVEPVETSLPCRQRPVAAPADCILSIAEELV